MYPNFVFDKNEERRVEREQLRITREEYGAKLAKARASAKAASKETSKRRKAIEDRKKKQEIAEEKRRQDILEERKSYHRQQVQHFRRRTDSEETRRPVRETVVIGAPKHRRSTDYSRREDQIPTKSGRGQFTYVSSRPAFHDLPPSTTVDLDEALQAIGAEPLGRSSAPMTHTIDNEADSPTLAEMDVGTAKMNSLTVNDEDHTVGLQSHPPAGEGAPEAENEGFLQVPTAVLSYDSVDESCSDIDTEAVTKQLRQVSPLRNPATQHLFEQPATISLDGTSVVRRLFNPKQRPTSPAWQVADATPSAENVDSDAATTGDDIAAELEDSLDEENLSGLLGDDTSPRESQSEMAGGEGKVGKTTPIGEAPEGGVGRRFPTPYFAGRSKQREDLDDSIDSLTSTPVPDASHHAAVAPALQQPVSSSMVAMTSSDRHGTRSQPFVTASAVLPTWSAAPRTVAAASNVDQMPPQDTLQSSSVVSYAGEAKFSRPKSRQQRSASLSSLQPNFQAASPQDPAKRLSVPTSSHDPRPRSILKNTQKRTALHFPSPGQEALQDHLSRMQRAHSDGQLAGMKRNIQFLDHDIILNDMKKNTPPPVHQGLAAAAANQVERRYGRIQPPVFQSRNNYLASAQRSRQAPCADGRDVASLRRPGGVRAGVLKEPMHPPPVPFTSDGRGPSPVVTMVGAHDHTSAAGSHRGHVVRVQPRHTTTSSATTTTTTANMGSSTGGVSFSRGQDQVDGARASISDQRLSQVRQILSTARHDLTASSADGYSAQRPAPGPGPTPAAAAAVPTGTIPPHIKLRKPSSTSSTSDYLDFCRAMSISGSGTHGGLPRDKSTGSSATASAALRSNQLRLQLQQQAGGTGTRASGGAQASAQSRQARGYGKPLPATSGSESYSRMLERYRTTPAMEHLSYGSLGSHDSLRSSGQVGSASRQSVASVSDSLPAEPASKDLVQKEKDLLKSLEHIDKMLLEKAGSSAVFNGPHLGQGLYGQRSGSRSKASTAAAAVQRGSRSKAGAPSPAPPPSRRSGHHRSGDGGGTGPSSSSSSAMGGARW